MTKYSRKDDVFLNLSWCFPQLIMVTLKRAQKSFLAGEAFFYGNHVSATMSEC